VSDLTLGDFWGIGNKDYKLDNNTGTSELLINSEKGRELLEKVKDKVFLEEVDLEYGIKANFSLTSSVKLPPQRSNFFAELDNKTFEQLSKEYFKKEPYMMRKVMKIKVNAYRFLKKAEQKLRKYSK
jgi:hypothetical protein